MRSQSGVTLVSLLVGTVISLIAILGTLTLYKSLVQNTATTVQAAKRDRVLAAALLTAEKEVLGAGFRVTTPEDALRLAAVTVDDDNEPTVSSSNAYDAYDAYGSSAPPISDTAEQNALLWYYETATTTHCAGLATLRQGKKSILALINKSCTSASFPDDGAWDSLTSLAEIALDDEEDPSPILLDLTRGNCYPFHRNGESASNAVIITISVTPSTDRATVRQETCLINFAEAFTDGSSTGETDSNGDGTVSTNGDAQ